jgi:hypothetical protein
MFNLTMPKCQIPNRNLKNSITKATLTTSLHTVLPNIAALTLPTVTYAFYLMFKNWKTNY